MQTFQMRAKLLGFLCIKSALYRNSTQYIYYFVYKDSPFTIRGVKSEGARLVYTKILQLSYINTLTAEPPMGTAISKCQYHIIMCIILHTKLTPYIDL